MLLVMKAESPLDGKIYYFVDKCLPFGASISCAHFQAVSDAMAHVFRFKTGEDTINYLDDYFFADLLRALCDRQIDMFLKLCTSVGLPISLEKTFWSSTQLIFLGLLIDTVREKIFIPAEKVQMAVEIISTILNKQSKKITIKLLQRICGLLNFFGRCIVPARAFCRRLYAKTTNTNLKPHHHVRVDREMRLDLHMWLKFLQHPTIFSRPFSDFEEVDANEIDMYSDSSKNSRLGCGGYCGTDWFMTKWDPEFINNSDPSIEYLELYAVTVAILNWIQRFEGKHVALFCDNMSVVYMLNSKTSSCKNCMVLIRFIVLKGLLHNVRISAKHVTSKDNLISDLLSRQKYEKFRELTGSTFNELPTELPNDIWPIQKIWLS